MAGDRLSALDVAFLCLESRTSPMHMGAVVTFRATEPVRADRIAALLAERAARLPRLRRRVRQGWPLGGASWVEDADVDPAEHVDTHRLTARYDPDPLATHASRWLARPLDLAKPLWRARVVTGLPDGSFAVLVKLHHALIDGAGAVETVLGLLDEVPAARRAGAARGRPAPSRSPVDALRAEAAEAVSRITESAGIAGSVLKATRPYPVSPIAATGSASRRLGFARVDLADVRRIRGVRGGTTNDVVLAILAGALREWLLNRGQRPDAGPLRVLVPVSLRGREADRAGGNVLSGYLCDLPVHLDDPVDRLDAVRAAMLRNKQAGPARGAGALPVLANRVPPGVHRVATRLAGHAAPLLFDTVVTNVPVPSVPLALDGAVVRDVYPFVPLAPHHAVGIAVACYRNIIHIGLQADGVAVADIGSLGDAVTKSTAALLRAVEYCPADPAGSPRPVVPGGKRSGGSATQRRPEKVTSLQR
ncbi:acyltransferase, WS/DGAT/MGAT [Amycolatopsis arida]|uniref:Diacylglycerol O-acyltransferase n=1 Tax=Amycolatopsis arida TaxID=587909 RepID=A0A1I5XSK8_9PSEU|nr:wax ester/triacylglycerol synthase family O-acyltransferase [Amycolatopsis arida]TDX97288.1 WS/DGAT/MGAT family acyltransferase [Amycolatopsis arida]SFQ34914.1 acyltransferase, WS/DGAT/MGAT [Amycolatopsis arida]